MNNSGQELAVVVGPVAAFVVAIAFTIIIVVIVIVHARRYRGRFAVVSHTHAHCPHISHHLLDGTACVHVDSCLSGIYCTVPSACSSW